MSRILKFVTDNTTIPYKQMFCSYRFGNIWTLDDFREIRGGYKNVQHNLSGSWPYVSRTLTNWPPCFSPALYNRLELGASWCPISYVGCLFFFVSLYLYSEQEVPIVSMYITISECYIWIQKYRCEFNVILIICQSDWWSYTVQTMDLRSYK